MIARDLAYSGSEERFYCFGTVGEVSSHCAVHVSVRGDSHDWRWLLARASESMSKRTKYSNEPIKTEVIPDFLPSPDQLAVGEEGVKVTISLSRRSVDFFKKAAERKHTSYQRMIRRLLDAYADRYRRDLTKHSSGRSKTRAAER